jgi:hypothetical protein
VISCGGSTLLNRYYGGSITNMLRSLYPSHEWKPWKFTQAPRNFWRNMDNLRLYIDELVKLGTGNVTGDDKLTKLYFASLYAGQEKRQALAQHFKGYTTNSLFRMVRELETLFVLLILDVALSRISG